LRSNTTAPEVAVIQQRSHYAADLSSPTDDGQRFDGWSPARQLGATRFQIDLLFDQDPEGRF
jgi:hypothetical protein